MLMIIYHLKMLAYWFDTKQEIANPNYYEELEYNSKIEKALDYFIYSVYGFTIISMGITGQYLENTLGEMRLVFYLFIVGVSLAAIVLFVLKVIYPQYYRQNEKRQQIIFCFGLAIIFNIVAGGFILNYLTGKESEHISQKVKIDSKGNNAKSGTRYIHFELDSVEHRISPNAEEFELIQEGDSISIKTGKGILNFEYVYEIEKLK